jgi:flagellin
MQKLSSGYRINSASDDAAGLAISNKLTTNIRSLTVAAQNTSEAKAMVGIAEGSADQVVSILERMKELATQAASANIGGDADKTQAEFQTLQQEIDRIVQSTNYQGTALLTGSFGSSYDTATSTLVGVTGIDNSGVNTGGAANGTYTLTQAGATVTLVSTTGISQALTAVAGVQTLNFSALGISLTTNGSFVTTANNFNGKTVVQAGTQATYQVGTGNNGYDHISISLTNIQTTALAGGALGTATIGTQGAAQAALGTVDTALNSVNSLLGTIGATVNRLDYTYNNLQATVQNYSASESAIKDVDMASEMTNFTKSQILEQAGTAMLAQANSSSQNILTLFK